MENSVRGFKLKYNNKKIIKEQRYNEVYYANNSAANFVNNAQYNYIIL